MKAMKPMFKLVWQTSLPDDDALLQVDMVSSGHGSTRVWLRPREIRTLRLSGEGPVFFQARLPSGTLFQQIVNDIQIRKLHRIVVKEAVPPPSYSLKWHAILGTLGQPESPPTGQPKPKTGKAKAAPAKGRAAPARRIVAREVMFHQKPKVGKPKPVQKSPVKFLAAKKSPAKFSLARPSAIRARTQVRRDAKLREAAVRIWTYLGAQASPWQIDTMAATASIKWFKRVAVIHLSDRRFDDQTPQTARPHRVLELCKPGFLSRFVVLPPVTKIQALVRYADAPAHIGFTDALTMEVVPFQTRGGSPSPASSALAYMRQGTMGEVVERLALDLVKRQRTNLHASDPFAATVGAYYLLCTGHFDKLGTMPLDLDRLMPSLPDSALVYAWQLMTDPGPYHYKKAERVDQIKKAILEAAGRGIPLLMMGLRFLFERLRQLRDGMTPDHPLAARFGNVVSTLGRLIDASEPTGQFTTFFGSSPWHPTRDAAADIPADAPTPTDGALTLADIKRIR